MQKTSAVLLGLLATAAVLAFFSISHQTHAASFDDASWTNEDIIILEDLLLDEQFRSSIRDMLIETYGLEFLENQAASLEQAGQIHSRFPVTRDGRVIYPPNYGGTYLDSRGIMTTLVVYPQYVDPDAYGIDRLIIPFGNNVRFVRFSRAYLVALSRHQFEFLTCATSIYHPVNLNLGSSQVDVINNVFVVNLRVLDDEHIEAYRLAVSDSEAIVFALHEFDDELAILLPTHEQCQAEPPWDYLDPFCPNRRASRRGFNRTQYPYVSSLTRLSSLPKFGIRLCHCSPYH